MSDVLCIVFHTISYHVTSTFIKRKLLTTSEIKMDLRAISQNPYACLQSHFVTDSFICQVDEHINVIKYCTKTTTKRHCAHLITNPALSLLYKTSDNLFEQYISKIASALKYIYCLELSNGIFECYNVNPQ